jgi:NAD(P)-dependent dehydrogenase (short-subunit alcohol dehydrogenase family)/acyl dehydratase
VSATIRLTPEHVLRFAQASGDRNPLHVDESFARTTSYGRCIAHGALVTIAAVGAVDAQLLQRLQRLEVRFRQPVLPGETYAVSLVRHDDAKAQVEVARGGAVAATIALESGATALPSVDAQRVTARIAPLHQTLEVLAAAGEPLSEPYGCDLAELRALAAELGASALPEAVLAWLAAASYTVGMLVPGLDAVFVGARIARASAPDSGGLTAAVAAVDDRTGLVAVDVALDQGEASARMSLNAFLLPRVPPPDRASIRRHLSPSDSLAGRNVLVVGASRGLGAAVTAAFATQGATVWAGFARSGDGVEELRAEFGRERIRPLAFDAGDAAQTSEAFSALRAGAGSLEGVVFCAAPPLRDATLHPDVSDETLRFVHSSLALTLVPLAETLRSLVPGGWLAFMSSSALDDPPETWPHYVTAKAALEGAAAYCSRHTGARVLVVRAPRLWTDSTNTPLARVGATPTEAVAAAIVRWVLTPGEPSERPTVIGPDDLPAEGAA